MTTSFDGLMDELRKLDIRDDHALIEWLMRTFMKAHDDNVDELPIREETAIYIGRQRKLLPDPDLSAEPPSHERGNVELAAWLIQRAVKLCLTAPSGPVPLSLAYWYFTEAAQDYLGRE